MAYISRINLFVICSVCFLPFCVSNNCTEIHGVVTCYNVQIVHPFVDNLKKDPSSVTTIVIYGGNIQYLNGSDFKNIKRLNMFSVKNLQSLSISDDVFIDNSLLRIVQINNTTLSELRNEVFRNNSKLENIDLSCNHLKSIDANVFKGLSSLCMLKLDNNNISELNANIFTSCRSLETLNLTRNKLSLLDPEIFMNLNKLVSIDLHSNFLQELKPGTFNSCVSLKTLNISNNSIKTLSQDVFLGVSNLTVLKLSNNTISYLRSGTFDLIVNLIELYVEDNPLKSIDNNIWDQNLLLKKVLVDYYTFTCVLGSSAKLQLSKYAFFVLTVTQTLKDCDLPAVESRSNLTCNETLEDYVSSGAAGTLSIADTLVTGDTLGTTGTPDPGTTDPPGQSDCVTLIIITAISTTLFIALLAYNVGCKIYQCLRKGNRQQEVADNNQHPGGNGDIPLQGIHSPRSSENA